MAVRNDDPCLNEIGPSPAQLSPDELHAQFVLQKVQPALLGLMEGSVSILAPILAAAGLTGHSLPAFMWAWPHRWAQPQR